MKFLNNTLRKNNLLRVILSKKSEYIVGSVSIACCTAVIGIESIKIIKTLLKKNKEA